MRRTLSKFFSLFILVVGAFSTFDVPCFGQGYTPEHPEVKKLIQQGLKHLSTIKLDSTPPWGVGGRLLTGYAILKATDDHDHPSVKAIAKQATRFAKTLNAKDARSSLEEKVVYSAAVAAIFLAALDADEYRSDIDAIANFLLSIQKENGCFNYLHALQGANGDVSQSQYVALAFWSLKQARIDVKDDAVESLAAWLLRAQRPDGSWTYMFPSEAEGPTHSMAAAGLSGTLVSGDSVGVLRSAAAAAALLQEVEGDIVPAAFRPVIVKPIQEQSNSKLKREDLQSAIARNQRWVAAHPVKNEPTEWYYYWLYSRERAEAFIGLMDGKIEASPRWYNQGVEELKKFQSKAGGWGIDQICHTGDEISTCFAILFLLRNTQKSIGNFNTADSIGGFGLANVADVGAVGGKLIDKSQVTSVDDALKLLEANGSGAGDEKLLADRMVLDSDPKKRKEQLNRFARMLRSPDTKARRIAAKLLGRGDDLDFAPDLIFALSEGEKDGQVMRTAETSLRILSRQLETYKLPKDGPITTKDRVYAEQHWKAWYLSIRPDYIFISE